MSDAIVETSSQPVIENPAESIKPISPEKSQLISQTLERFDRVRDGVRSLGFMDQQFGERLGSGLRIIEADVNNENPREAGAREANQLAANYIYHKVEDQLRKRLENVILDRFKLNNGRLLRTAEEAFQSLSKADRTFLEETDQGKIIFKNVVDSLNKTPPVKAKRQNKKRFLVVDSPLLTQEILRYIVAPISGFVVNKSIKTMNYQKNKLIKALALASFIASFVAVFFLLVLSVNQVQAVFDSEIILQPASGLNNGTDEGTISGGKDTYVSSTRYGNLDPDLGTDVNFGSKDELWFDYYADYDGYPLLKFDVSDLPASDVVSAKLYLYVTANCGGGSCPNMDWNVNAITSPWNEMSATWNTRPTLGGSYGTLNIPASPSNGAPNESGHDHWVSVDITDLYNGWKSGTITNYGIGFTRLGSTWDGGVWFNKVASSDYETASLRPKLVIQGGFPSPTPTPTPTDIPTPTNTPTPIPTNTPTPTPLPAGYTVKIDIKPGSYPNPINPKSNGKIPVAILSSTTFNALTQIDKTTLTFGRTGNEKSLSHCNTNGEDVNNDGLLDLVCHFQTQQSNFLTGDTEGKLKGKTISTIPLTGKDSIRITPQ